MIVIAVNSILIFQLVSRPCSRSYTNRQRILVVGDGDFSFSLAIASALGGEGIVCTSLDKDTQLKVLGLKDFLALNSSLLD